MKNTKGVGNYYKENTHYLDNVRGAFISIDKVNKMIYICGNIKGIFGVEGSEEKFSLEEFEKIICCEDRNNFYSLFNDYNERKENIQISIYNHNGESKLISIIGMSIIENDEIIGFEGYISNSLNYNYNKEKSYRYYHIDEVTGLQNKNSLKDKINLHLDINKKNNNKSALIVLGLDNFRYINDSFGSQCGDLFFKIISEELKEKIVVNDFICRLQGDEFLIFLNNVQSLNEIEIKAKSIIDIFNKSYKILNNKIYVTTSIGIAIYPDDGLTFATLLKNADAAMDEAKIKGKNQYQFFNNDIARKVDKYYVIQNGLINAIEKNEMYVVFQPKVILAHDKVSGFEALLRWKNEEIGQVGPNEFIPVAESTGLIIPIGEFVLKEVFKKIKVLLASGYDNFKIAVNLSEIQLRDSKIVDLVKNLCNEFEVDGRYIEFEITESILIKSYENTIKQLYELKELGITIALDDFGTGYSSLNYLTRLPIDVLKIDRSFVVDMVENHKSRWIVENIIELSHKLGIEVVAEGVEIKEQVTYLKSILCDVVQGYFYSKPEMFENVVELLDKCFSKT